MYLLVADKIIHLLCCMTARARSRLYMLSPEQTDMVVVMEPAMLLVISSTGLCLPGNISRP